jgi:hypothetical protein
MNCPSCSAPLLFGATSCVCGYHATRPPSEASVVDVSYWEALRASWRAWWPTQLIVILFWVGFWLFDGWAVVACGVASIVALGAALFLLVPRLVSGPYRDFSLVVVATMDGGTGNRLRLDQRARVSFFLWWRHLAASPLAVLAAALVSAVLLLLLMSCGIDYFGGAAVAAWPFLAGPVLLHVFIVGPVLVKMLVGHPFQGFLIEARR